MLFMYLLGGLLNVHKGVGGEGSCLLNVSRREPLARRGYVVAFGRPQGPSSLIGISCSAYLPSLSPR